MWYDTTKYLVWNYISEENIGKTSMLETMLETNCDWNADKQHC